jgi:hypothetical protein
MLVQFASILECLQIMTLRGQHILLVMCQIALRENSTAYKSTKTPLKSLDLKSAMLPVNCDTSVSLQYWSQLLNQFAKSSCSNSMSKLPSYSIYLLVSQAYTQCSDTPTIVRFVRREPYSGKETHTSTVFIGVCVNKVSGIIPTSRLFSDSKPHSSIYQLKKQVANTYAQSLRFRSCDIKLKSLLPTNRHIRRISKGLLSGTSFLTLYLCNSLRIL